MAWPAADDPETTHTFLGLFVGALHVFRSYAAVYYAEQFINAALAAIIFASSHSLSPSGRTFIFPVSASRF